MTNKNMGRPMSTKQNYTIAASENERHSIAGEYFEKLETSDIPFENIKWWRVKEKSLNSKPRITMQPNSTPEYIQACLLCVCMSSTPK